MVSQLMKNSALCAKVHAMNGKALTVSDLEAMSNMKSVPAVAGYLMENTSYREVLKDVSVRDIHRGELERILGSNLIADVRRLKPYMDKNSASFIELALIETDINNIVFCVRRIISGYFDDAEKYLETIPGIKTTNSGINNIEELIEYFKNTIYYEPLKMFKGKPEIQKPFYIETALNIFWANLILKYSKKFLTKDEQKTVFKFYGTMFDISNISYILRLKKTFDMTDSEIYASIIPKYYKLTEEIISELVRAKDYEEALEKVKTQTPYGDAFIKDDRYTDKRQAEYVLKVLNHIYRTNRYSVHAVIKYLYRRTAEISAITSITEGIRYGIPPEKIREQFVDIREGGFGL